MTSAKIETVNVEKGFGFLRPHDGGQDVFFHHSAYQGDFGRLGPGDEVTFEIDPSAERPRANMVTFVKKASGSSPRHGSRAQRNDSARPSRRAEFRGRIPQKSKERPYGNSQRQPSSPAARRPVRQSEVPKDPRRDSARRERLELNRPAGCQNGFVTKLRRDGTYGFISADAGGTEIRFEPPVVKGERSYQRLKVGDYVEFSVAPETVGTKIPEATYVRAIERLIRFARTNLPRHPRARRKKPTWR
jgi:CspA family cold shock protein